ncbi:cob(I)yrinic acid a,c-diamide adenosyltransferase [Gelria sp. Kuro-4]|uniref:cob(I)yrinic acid a,c-diamide adenosyltransferase n=1 Tax=Gelria sp. Kuro-4 TaxID=2796927 RepID=UPI001BEDC2AA|nr:cob(I)yrinic acid a,c-diamide adenosyltransferase [Gelria sp. Kuro-4]BCV25852.1 propanediol utilization protein [Gelria sp. Kuro-4]
MKVYTRTGDKGETSLWGGRRVSKADLQVECYGTVDEANSWLGLARGLVRSRRAQELLPVLQARLQILASELASTPEGLLKLKERLQEDDIRRLEQAIDEIQATLPPQKGFVLPGGTRGAGALDVARTVVRRAERLVVRLRQERRVREELVRYLNRLSDLLYVLARAEGDEELVQLVKEKVLERLGVGRERGLTLEAARRLVTAAQKQAERLGLPVVAAVVDSAGQLLLLERQVGALIASIDIAWKKAYTAAVLKMPTHTLADLAQPGQPLFGIEATNEGRLVIFGGGFPLLAGGEVVGALGVSGGTVEQDMEVAQAAVRVWEEENVSGK